jgi:DNA-binding IclR family transcriptional regulator
MKTKKQAQESTPKKITSVIKALRILELFDPSNSELSLSQISKKLGWPKSTLSNFVRTLETEGYLSRNPLSQNYFLGIKLMELGYNMRSNLSIVHYAIPCMEDLCEQTRGNVYLTTHVDGSVLYLEGIYSNRRTTKYSIAGKLLPMHVTANGKAMLSYMPAEHVKAIIRKHSLVASTKNSITNEAALFQDIKQAHDRGYAIDNEEETLGVRCLGMAIRDRSGYPVGALSISGSIMNLTEDRYEQLASLLTEACTTLSSYATMFPYSPITVEK